MPKEEDDLLLDPLADEDEEFIMGNFKGERLAIPSLPDEDWNDVNQAQLSTDQWDGERKSTQQWDNQSRLTHPEESKEEHEPLFAA